MGFVSGNQSNILLAKKVSGEFLIRFSTSVLGAIVITCFHNSKAVNILIKVVKDFLIIGDTPFKSLQEVFRSKNLKVLRTVYPNHPINEFFEEEIIHTNEENPYDENLHDRLSPESLAFQKALKRQISSLTVKISSGYNTNIEHENNNNK